MPVKCEGSAGGHVVRDLFAPFVRALCGPPNWLFYRNVWTDWVPGSWLELRLKYPHAMTRCRRCIRSVAWGTRYWEVLAPL
jgi:hypothetical protein